MTKFTKLLMSTMLLIASTACEPAPTGNPYTSDSDDSDTEQGDDDSTTNDSTTGDSATGGNSNSDTDNNISTTSIAALKSLYKGSTTRITTTLSVTGQVVANDIRGEFDDVIVLDDGYDGIQISVSNDPLYYNYPIGSTVVCQCEDLYIGSDYGVLRLGAKSTSDDEVVSAIEDNALNKITLSTDSSAPIPTVVKISDLTDRMVSRFVRLETVMFKQSGTLFCERDTETGRSISTTHTLADAWGNEIYLYVPSTVEYSDMTTPDGWFNINVILESGSNPYKARPICFEIY